MNMQTTWAERQIIYARRLGILRQLKPGAFRVYDTVLMLDLDRNEPVRIAGIAAAAKVSRSVVTRALAELEHLRLIERFRRPGTHGGDSFLTIDLAPRADMLRGLRQRPAAQ